MKTASEDVRYGFADGRVRALENTLLDRQRYDRLVRASGPTEFQSILADTVYGHHLSDEGGANVERALDLAGVSFYGFIEQHTHDTWVLRWFRQRADFYNLKIAVKGKLAGRGPATGNLLGGGDWAQEQLVALASGEEGAEPKVVRDAVQKVLDEIDVEPAAVDAALDRVAQEQQLALAAGSAFVSGYLAVHADVENIRSFVRARALGENKAVFQQAFLPGGTLLEGQLVELWSEELDAVAGRLRMTRYARLVEDGVAGVRQGTMLRLERLGREHKLAFLLRARYMTFGYEPLVAYYLFRENEITNLRQLYAAKEARLVENLCREMVAYAE
jgi:V/A-type H+-transporting ATPase subunit C